MIKVLRLRWSTTRSADNAVDLLHEIARPNGRAFFSLHRNAFSALPALALIAATMHSRHAKIGVRIDVRCTCIMRIMDRFRDLIDMARMCVRGRPARPLTHPLFLCLQQSVHLFGGLLGSERLFA